jgi:hypothetical protein
MPGLSGLREAEKQPSVRFGADIAARLTLAVLPESPGKDRYCIRSQDDRKTEHVAQERELHTA